MWTHWNPGAALMIGLLALIVITQVGIPLQQAMERRLDEKSKKVFKRGKKTIK